MKISEIYAAIQGETSYAGEPCTIIRLAGCNLECSWCDTPQREVVKQELSIEAILDQCRTIDLPLILLTGGEPLLQKESLELMRKLVEQGYTVLLETNGSLPLDGIPEPVVTIMDVKCPGSGMQEKMRLENLQALRPWDEVKFVIADRRDFDYALGLVTSHHLSERMKVLFSPEFDQMDAGDLGDWILETRLPIRLNLQIHKYIWGQDARER